MSGQTLAVFKKLHFLFIGPTESYKTFSSGVFAPDVHRLAYTCPSSDDLDKDAIHKNKGIADADAALNSTVDG